VNDDFENSNVFSPGGCNIEKMLLEPDSCFIVLIVFCYMVAAYKLHVGVTS